MIGPYIFTGLEKEAKRTGVKPDGGIMIDGKCLPFWDESSRQTIKRKFAEMGIYRLLPYKRVKGIQSTRHSL